MQKNMPIAVTFRNGNTVRTTVDAFNLTSYLMKLDMDQVTAIEYGEAAANPPVQVKLSGIDTGFSESAATIRMNLYDKNDKRVAFVEAEPVKFQQFAVNLLQQTTYRFEDTVRKLKDK